jgi:hypothetical protein
MRRDERPSRRAHLLISIHSTGYAAIVAMFPCPDPHSAFPVLQTHQPSSYTLPIAQLKNLVRNSRKRYKDVPGPPRGIPRPAGTPLPGPAIKPVLSSPSTGGGPSTVTDTIVSPRKMTRPSVRFCCTVGAASSAGAVLDFLPCKISFLVLHVMISERPQIRKTELRPQEGPKDSI